MKKIILIVMLLCAGTVFTAGCASAPPVGLYTVDQTKIYNTENAEQTVIALSQTAINLNGQGHLSDADTRLVRDFALTFDTWRVSYASGSSIVAQAQSSFTVLTNSLSTDATSNTLKASLALVLAAINAIQ